MTSNHKCFSLEPTLPPKPEAGRSLTTPQPGLLSPGLTFLVRAEGQDLTVK